MPFRPGPSTPTATSSDPPAEFPFAPERKYTPCDASKDQLFALRDHLGISRNVIVQATCHGADNTAMVDAVQSAGDRARGIATVRPDVTDTELRRLDDAGVRGVRFNFVKRLVDASPKEDLATIAKKIAPLGWHVVIYFEAADLPDLQDFFTALPVPLVVDHMGRPDVTHPWTGRSSAVPAVRRPRRRLGQGQLPGTAQRHRPRALDGEQHAYTDVVPFARRVVEEFPGPVLWGTDWPHPNLTDHMPDDGLLVDYLPQIAVTAEQQHQLLVANPMRLYWPGEDA